MSDAQVISMMRTEADGCWFVVIGRKRGRKAHSKVYALACFRRAGLIRRWQGK